MFSVAEGSSETDNGIKWQWSTVNFGHYCIYSMGKEHANLDAHEANASKLWKSIIEPRGEFSIKDWTDK